MNGSDLSALSLFARVAEQQSFSAAAQPLGISNSVASYTIRRLEDQLGTKLFNRTTRSVSLTEAGSEFLKRIQPLMEQLDLAFNEVGRASSGTMGTLRLNVLRASIALVIAPVLKEFLNVWPARECAGRMDSARCAIPLLLQSNRLAAQAEGLHRLRT
ncbi:LysR family transcriptional regulator [Paraburkholderia sp. CNPSo 3274]|uniref:LysR family transcriptional regulator n=1 Tax=Paraburkholderia sp. CNPSo 3274 TaxID=2940932 RepID=UPI0020B726E8|nr:LysR family transcriptional regulator [Paraburkholderia sp. CNPSo 3274]MCP3709247.1 LysR family transcriptional regulator [Paraburkholderia sp. CNPSo 3274]